MPKIKHLLFLGLLLLNISLKAQSNADTACIAKNVGSFELGGSSMLASLGYERIFPLAERHKIATGLGFIYLSYDDSYYSTLAPNLSYLYGIKHHLEIGLGYSWIYLSDNSFAFDAGDFIYGFNAKLGYRYQKPEGGFMFKASALVLNFASTEFPSQGYVTSPWLGIAVGWGF